MDWQYGQGSNSHSHIFNSFLIISLSLIKVDKQNQCKHSGEVIRTLSAEVIVATQATKSLFSVYSDLLSKLERK